jgi:hypothetical protein
MLAGGFADDPLTRGAIGADADVSLPEGAAGATRAVVALRVDERLAARTLSPIRLASTEAMVLAAPTAEGAPSPTRAWPCIESDARGDGPMDALAPWLEAGVGANVGGPTVGRLK